MFGVIDGELREASNDPLLYLNSRPPTPSYGFGLIDSEVREARDDPLVSFFASSDPAGSLDQIVEGVQNGGAEGLQNYINLGINISRYYNVNII